MEDCRHIGKPNRTFQVVENSRVIAAQRAKQTDETEKESERGDEGTYPCFALETQ